MTETFQEWESWRSVEMSLWRPRGPTEVGWCPKNFNCCQESFAPFSLFLTYWIILPELRQLLPRWSRVSGLRKSQVLKRCSWHVPSLLGVKDPHRATQGLMGNIYLHLIGWAEKPLWLWTMMTMYREGRSLPLLRKDKLNFNGISLGCCLYFT